ncbi:phage head morphogenesis protein, SPP1 gp7 family [Serratia ficaria]|uniref:phage head morphogenesis protein n=1 Tax=Serratia ficaria TaxID=61651 RepID=UPI0021839793|nr:phage minor head protein [Serratia ficaria]CAI2536222.1 phage head morphogenesis protein, SPP1 gp7 family [Serratia ficaria]
MPISKEEISALFGMKPEAALRYLENKGLRIRTDADAMQPVDHAHAFGFANLARLDIAQDLVNGLREGLANGQTPEWFVKNLEPVLRKKGWWGSEENIDTDTGEITTRQLGNPARLNTIYRTNTQAAYMSARHASMLANAENRPYWRYVAVMDAKTRPSHARLHNRVFHYLDPIWQYIFPPNGFNCRCRAEALTEREVKQWGYVISRTDSEVVQQVMTGEDDNGCPIFTPVNGVRFSGPDGQAVTFFPDVGFDVNPGKEVWRANLDKYDVELSRPYVSAGLAGPELTHMLSDVAQGNRTGEILAAGVLDAGEMATLGTAGRTAWLAEHQLSAPVI